MRHVNSGNCPKCEEIFARFPGFHSGLKKWFKELQVRVPSAHISCAGRGEVEQEAARLRGASRASFGKSAHNWNAAIDLFEMQGDSADLYELPWFKENIAPHIPDTLQWYGETGASFYELPHIEVRGWHELAKNGLLKIVE